MNKVIVSYIMRGGAWRGYRAGGYKALLRARGRVASTRLVMCDVLAGALRDNAITDAQARELRGACKGAILRAPRPYDSPLISYACGLRMVELNDIYNR